MPAEDHLWLKLSLKCSMNALQLTHNSVAHIANYVGLAFIVASVLPQNSTRDIMNEEETL